jgi:hypothetical protein
VNLNNKPFIVKDGVLVNDSLKEKWNKKK